jgi:uncharacterized protein
MDRASKVTVVLAELRRTPVVAMLGARQIGKTTLARDVAARFPGKATLFDLENPEHVRRLDDPLAALEDLRGLVVLDEIQHRPDLFPVLRVLADRPRRLARFLVLGSASGDLLRQSSESLAGRIHYEHLGGFWLGETGISRLDRLWLRGGFPRAFLARSEAESTRWRRDFLQTFLQRDLPQLGFRIPAATLYRFWSMLAHYHAQIWNGAELARAFGVTEATVKHWLDVLEATFAVRVLRPWYENLSKRQVKAPKLYLSDSGVLHTLLDIGTRDELRLHPKIGASWEGFAIAQIVEHLGARPEECFYWRTHQGAELDLLVVRGRERRGFEVKVTRVPEATRSMRIACEDLRLERIDVIHAGPDTFPMNDQLRAVSARRLLDDVAPLKRTS